MVDGHDVLAVMPTGSGNRSAFSRGDPPPATSLVVSPLISLMKIRSTSCIAGDSRRGRAFDAADPRASTYPCSPHTR